LWGQSLRFTRLKEHKIKGYEQKIEGLSNQQTQPTFQAMIDNTAIKYSHSKSQDFGHLSYTAKGKEWSKI